MQLKVFITLQLNINTPYFVYEKMHICNLFLLLVVKNVAVEERNKLYNFGNVLIRSTKYRFGRETDTV